MVSVDLAFGSGGRIDHDDWTRMARSKSRTTMAKLNRERKLLERRAAKQAKKDARKKAAAEAE